VELLIGVFENGKKQDLLKMIDTALDLSNGLIYFDDFKKVYIFSTFGLCPKCGSNIPDLDMRHFSFNSPLGACPRCTGLGVTMEVDPDLVMPNKRLSLAEGAIQPWTRITGNQNGYQKLLASVAFQHNFSLSTPINELPKEVIDLLINGTGEEVYEVGSKRINFSGVVEDLKQRHLSTSSDYTRREIENYMREQTCPACQGKRLRPEVLKVKFSGMSIVDLACTNIEDSGLFLKNLMKNKIGKIAKTDPLRQASEAGIAGTIIKEVVERLANLERVGLGYLNLDRQMNSLSGGEVTRVRLSTQLTSGLAGVVYILDEPSVGLHPRDNNKLIDTLKYLRDMGNSVIVVEHDMAIMKAADHIIDVGPGAGVYGGEIIAQGTLADIKKNKKSITGEYLSGKLKVGQYLERETKKKTLIKKAEKEIKIFGAKAYNLKNINVSIPLGKLVCVTGVSGSGKSSLVVKILGRALSKHFYRAKAEPGAHKKITGLKNIDKVIAIDQTPIGRTPRSNPATYTGVFTLIRDLFSGLPEAKMRRYDAGKFSFNVKGGGRCEACGGEGYVRIPMQFLADVFVLCNDCNGTRYNQEALDIHYKGKNIAEILKMTIEEAYRFFADQRQIANKLNILRDVGLGYLELGQPATMLSGGEAQRIKLATELSRVSTGQTLYILDEPTTGLHFEDISRLLQVLTQLVDKGNSVVVIEHNIELIENSDWVIELGPEGGQKGGYLTAEGTPEKIAKNKKIWTGQYL
jgi:excinuclease ABC subunit A